jgi:uncharacterized membrane protein YgdD (TMEM256/DUF423 family)
MPSYFVMFAALNGALAVAGGAFAAHGLDAVADAQRIGWLKTAAEYQMMHAAAMLAIVALQGPRLTLWALSAGILFFAGSLYLMAVTGWIWLGAVTPIGGLAFILGWLALAWWAWQHRGETGDHRHD